MFELFEICFELAPHSIKSYIPKIESLCKSYLTNNRLSSSFKSPVVCLVYIEGLSNTNKLITKVLKSIHELLSFTLQGIKEQDQKCICLLLFSILIYNI